MSYRVAFVKFPKSDNLYPVNCHRGDITAEDLVYVTMPQKRIHKKAKVHSVEYLNWKCRNTIYCLERELIYVSKSDSYRIERQSTGVRFHTAQDLISFLSKKGWNKGIPRARNYRLFLWIDNKERTAKLRFHGQGIDIQVFDEHNSLRVQEDGKISIDMWSGKIVTHRYYLSEVCMFEFIAEFATKFTANEDITKFMTQIGSNKAKRSKTLGYPNSDNSEEDNGLSLSELYNILSDGGDQPAYLGDGMYLGSDGTTY